MAQVAWEKVENPLTLRLGLKIGPNMYVLDSLGMFWMVKVQSAKTRFFHISGHFLPSCKRQRAENFVENGHFRTLACLEITQNISTNMFFLVHLVGLHSAKFLNRADIFFKFFCAEILGP